MSNAPKILINGTDPEQEKVKISKEIFKLYPAHYINNRLAEILLEEGRLQTVAIYNNDYR